MYQEQSDRIENLLRESLKVQQSLLKAHLAMIDLLAAIADENRESARAIRRRAMIEAA